MNKSFRFKKISWKLTLIYSVIFSLVLIFLNACTLYGVRYFLIQQARSQVQSSSSATMENLTSPGEAVNLTDSENLNEATLNSSLNIKITDLNGKTILSTNRFNLDKLSAVSGLGVTRVIETADRHLVVRNEAIISGNRVIAYLQVAYEMKREYGFIKLLFVLMAFADFAGIILSVFAGNLISKRTLKPIDKITKTAKSISISDLKSRIDVGEADDELSRLAITFNEMIERLRVSFEKQNRFVSDASHELRTPIAVIQGYADLIDRWGKNDSNVLQESINAIRNETENMTSLIEKLLFLARGDSGSIKLKKERFDLKSLLEEVVTESKLLTSGHRLSSHVDGAIEFYADKKLIKQMLRALIDNSIKYTPENGTISIEADSKDGRVRIIVEDTGIGIPQEEIANIFDRFYRVDKSRTKEKGGSGLGLSIVKWIVDAHGGTIAVQSTHGSGTRITAVFPQNGQGINKAPGC